MSIIGFDVLPDVTDRKVPFWRQCLRGLSCCAFQTNEFTGLIFILGLLLWSWHQAVFFVIAVVVGTFIVRLLLLAPLFNTPTLTGYRDAGILGFNAALIGVALGNFFVVNTALWITIPIMAAIVAIVNVILARWLWFPFLAAPFILCFWAIWPITSSLGLEKVPLGAWSAAHASYIPSLFASVGSTLFATKIVVGALFLVGVIVSNWRHAIMALMGALVAVAIAIHVHVPGGAISTGYVGFNAVLAALVACVVIAEDIRIALLCSLVATWIFAFMNASWPAPALASGFVLSIWLVIFLAWLNKYYWAHKASAAEEVATAPTAAATAEVSTST